MVACFLCKTGSVATVPLEQSRIVNSEWYTAICLPKVFGEIRKTNKRRRFIVYHGNPSSHTSAQITALLTGQNVELTGHPPYSPDITPNDFSLFPHIKKKMRGQRFSCWSVQKPCIGGVSIVKTNTKKMLSTVILKNVKLSYGNVRFHLATPERC